MRRSSDRLKELNGGLAIHFPSLEVCSNGLCGIPKLMACQDYGFVDFVLRKEQIEQLEGGGSRVHRSRGSTWQH